MSHKSLMNLQVALLHSDGRCDLMKQQWHRQNRIRVEVIRPELKPQAPIRTEVLSKAHQPQKQNSGRCSVDLEPVSVLIRASVSVTSHPPKWGPSSQLESPA
ncbi:hypothetical protein QQF64_027159 [Cirrhinus molitorella]|uniref:Uncharacterized protein n=1 Tax=Cirrhinus molitorella TaxID=172907 RepID=A0ABR3NCC5_9TELE